MAPPLSFGFRIQLIQQETDTKAIMTIDALSWQLCREIFSLEAFSAIPEILDTLHAIIRELLFSRYCAFWKGTFTTENPFLDIEIYYQQTLQILMRDAGPAFSTTVLTALSGKDSVPERGQTNQHTLSLSTMYKRLTNELSGSLEIENNTAQGVSLIMQLPFPTFYINHHRR